MRHRLQRRILRFAIALGIVGCLGSSALAQDKGPIKIGFMAPYVGVFAKIGQDMDKGFRLGLEEVGYKAGGRQIVMITEDTEAKPELGPTKARKLIEKDKVDLLAGIAHSGVAMSVRDIVTDSKIPLVIANAGGVDLTGKLKSPYIFRISFANGQIDRAGGWYAYNKMGMKRMIVMAPDYSAGHEIADGFIEAFKAAGGQVVEEIYPPLGTTDFGPYLSKIQAKAKSIDGVWMFFAGSGAIRLMNQYSEYGLKQTVPLFVLGNTLEEPIRANLKEPVLGVKNYIQYCETLSNPANQRFVKAYMAKYKEAPGLSGEQGYVAAKVITMALQAVKGNVEDRKAFLAALRKVKFDAPRGPFAFDSNQNVVLTAYMGEIKDVGGRYANVVFDSIPNVDQNWTPARLKK